MGPVDDRLKETIDPYINDASFVANNDLLIILFDEAQLTDATCSGPITIAMTEAARLRGAWKCGGRTVALFLGAGVKRSVSVNHALSPRSVPAAFPRRPRRHGFIARRRGVCAQYGRAVRRRHADGHDAADCGGGTPRRLVRQRAVGDADRDGQQSRDVDLLHDQRLDADVGEHALHRADFDRDDHHAEVHRPSTRQETRRRSARRPTQSRPALRAAMPCPRAGRAGTSALSASAGTPRSRRGPTASRAPGRISGEPPTHSDMPTRR